MLSQIVIAVVKNKVKTIERADTGNCILFSLRMPMRKQMSGDQLKERMGVDTRKCNLFSFFVEGEQTNGESENPWYRLAYSYLFIPSAIRVVLSWLTVTYFIE